MDEAIAGADINRAVINTDATADHAFVFVFRGQFPVPKAFSVGDPKGGYAGLGIHGDQAVPDHHGPAQQFAFAARTFADTDFPGPCQILANFQMVHGMVRETSGLGPVRVAPGTGQTHIKIGDGRIRLQRLIQLQNGDTLARQRRFFGAAEPVRRFTGRQQ